MAELLSDIIDPNVLFLPAIEWSKVEQTLTLEKRAEYSEKGFPYLVSVDGKRFAYIPVIINGQSFKCVQGRDPRG